MKKLAIIGAILTVLPSLVIATQPALADTATQTFTVSIVINKSCTVSAPTNIVLSTGMGAGALSASGATGTTAFTVTCSTGTGYNIGFTGSNDVGTATTAHNMKGTGSNSSMIPYQLFDATSGTTNTSALTAVSAATPNLISDKGTGSAQSKGVKATVAVGAPVVPTDTYTDTVTLTVSY
jgi:spore coat protein U-like protein